jgi:hypothetical protein
MQGVFEVGSRKRRRRNEVFELLGALFHSFLGMLLLLSSFFRFCAFKPLREMI